MFLECAGPIPQSTSYSSAVVSNLVHGSTEPAPHGRRALTRCPKPARGSRPTPSIQPLLPLRPRLQSAMPPQPLLGILPHVVFNHLGEHLRVGGDIRLEIAG